jgi:hypothetical protein
VAGELTTVICNDDGTVVIESSPVVSVVTSVDDQTVIVQGDDSEIVVVEETTTVIEAADGSVTVSDVGIQGPAAEENVPFATRVDFVGETVIYKGQASPGTVDATNGWRIQQITFVGADEDVEIRWADGVSDFTKIWDDRLGYTYT